MIGDYIRAIIDLLKIRKEEKKLDIEIAKGPLDIKKATLEIDKAEREKAAAASFIITPDKISIDDIERYDPRARARREAIEAAKRAKGETSGAMRAPSPVLWVVTVILVIIVVIGIFSALL